MTKKNYTIGIIAILFATSSFAQMKIDSLGRTLVGTPYYPHDLYGVTTLSVFGNSGIYKAGSKLSFGDFGRRDHNGWNVFVGEYGTDDSDKLWLHGKRGFNLTVGNGFVLASYDYMYSPSLPWTTDWVGLRAINVRTNINATRFFNRFGNKTMGQPDLITGSLTQVMQLSPITYTYQTAEEDFGTENVAVQQIGDIPTTELTDKTTDDIAEDMTLRSELAADRFSYGLDLGGFEEQFPTLVSVDADGNKYVDYVSLVPVLVASIQEQQQIIENQNAIIEDIRTQMYKMQDTLHQLVKRRDSLATATNSYLDQNIPNPFDEETNIGYYISTDATMATLYIFNMSGLLIDALNITQFGTGSVDFDGSQLPEGMYVYTLVVDGNIADSKRMVIMH